jgi:hypothetical protein
MVQYRELYTGEWGVSIFTHSHSHTSEPKLVSFSRRRVSGIGSFHGSICSLKIHIAKLLGSNGRKIVSKMRVDGGYSFQHLAAKGTATEYGFDQNRVRFLRKLLGFWKKRSGNFSPYSSGKMFESLPTF